MNKNIQVLTVTLLSLTAMVSASDFAEAAGATPAITADAPAPYTAEQFRNDFKKNMGLNKEVTTPAPVEAVAAPVAAPIAKDPLMGKNGKPMLLEQGKKMPSAAEQSKAAMQASKKHYEDVAAKKGATVQEVTPSRFATVKEYVKTHKALVATGVVVTVVAAYGVYKLVTYTQAKRAQREAILAELRSEKLVA